MRRKSKVKIFLIAIDLVFFICILINPNFNTPQITDNSIKQIADDGEQAENKTSAPQTSDSAVLDYKEYCSISFEGGQTELCYWEFSGSNQLVGITVLAMTEVNYINFQNSQPCSGYTLSDGSYYSDNDAFYPPEYNLWYIVYYNNDTSMQSTSLTYDIEVIYNYYYGPGSNGGGGGRSGGSYDDYGSYLLLFFIILSVSGGSAVAGGVVYSIKKRKKEPVEPGKPIVQPSVKEKPVAVAPAFPTPKEPLVKFCPICGKQIRADVSFCTSCGASLKE